jgi:hypothetical protein
MSSQFKLHILTIHNGVQLTVSHLFDVCCNKYYVHTTATEQIHNKEQVYQCPASNKDNKYIY